MREVVQTTRKLYDEYIYPGREGTLGTSPQSFIIYERGCSNDKEII